MFRFATLRYIFCERVKVMKTSWKFLVATVLAFGLVCSSRVETAMAGGHGGSGHSSGNHIGSMHSNHSPSPHSGGKGGGSAAAAAAASSGKGGSAAAAAAASGQR